MYRYEDVTVMLDYTTLWLRVGWLRKFSFACFRENYKHPIIFLLSIILFYYEKQVLQDFDKKR